MQALLFSLLFSSFAAVGFTQDIDNNDIPSACQSVCSAVVSLTTQCDAQTEDDDSGYINCVCQGTDAANSIPECEACVAVYDERDNDVRDLVSSCSFTTTTWNTASTASTGSTTATSTSPTVVTTTDSSGSTIIQTTTPTGSGTTVATSTQTTTTGTSATAATGTSAAAAIRPRIDIGGLNLILTAFLGFLGLM